MINKFSDDDLCLGKSSICLLSSDFSVEIFL